MIIAGAKGFAIELLELVKDYRALMFFDNISTDLPDKIFNTYRILHDIESVKEYFDFDNRFILGVGNPKIRYALYNMLLNAGGRCLTITAPSVQIGSFNTTIDDGCCIMDGSTITNNVRIGKGCLINLHCTIGHDTTIGNFVELCPTTNISGHVTIGNYTFLGTNSAVIPGVTIGNNCKIGAGCIVTKDVPDNSVVVGLPGKIIKTVEPFIE